MIKNIHIDLDGVMADFEGFFETVFKKSVREDVNDDEAWQMIEDYEKETGVNWFRMLPPKKDAGELWTYVVSIPNVKVKVLSAASSGEHYNDNCIAKRLWVEKHMGLKDDDVVLVHSSEDKAQYATPESILIDDYHKSINPWIQNGGIGILHRTTAETISKLNEILKGN